MSFPTQSAGRTTGFRRMSSTYRIMKALSTTTRSRLLELIGLALLRDLLAYGTNSLVPLPDTSTPANRATPADRMRPRTQSYALATMAALVAWVGIASGCSGRDTTELVLIIPDGYRGPIALPVSGDGEPVNRAGVTQWTIKPDGRLPIRSVDFLAEGCVLSARYSDGKPIPQAEATADEVALRGGEIVNIGGTGEVLRYFVGTKEEHSAFTHEDWVEFLRH